MYMYMHVHVQCTRAHVHVYMYNVHLYVHIHVHMYTYMYISDGLMTQCAVAVACCHRLTQRSHVRLYIDCVTHIRSMCILGCTAYVCVHIMYMYIHILQIIC